MASLSRAECNEAAVAVEGALTIGIVSETEANEVLAFLDRLVSMLTRIGGLGA
jgi:hypothetical protein